MDGRQPARQSRQRPAAEFRQGHRARLEPDQRSGQGRGIALYAGPRSRPRHRSGSRVEMQGNLRAPRRGLFVGGSHARPRFAGRTEISRHRLCRT